MADIGAGAVRLVDSSGDAMDDVSSGALKIKVDSGGGAGTHGSSVVADGTQILLEAKDMDGGSFDNTVSEGQNIRAAASLSGVQYVTLTNELGRFTPLGTDNSAYSGLFINVGGKYNSSAPTYADGDNAVLQTDVNGKLLIAGTVELSSTDNTVLDNILTKNTEIDSVLDTIKVDTEAIETAVELLDNAIDGNEMQVDIVSAPTLTVNSHAVTNAGTFAVQIDGSALTSLQLLDDIVYTDDSDDFTLGSSKGIMMMGYAGSQTVNAGDVCALRSTINGDLYSHIGSVATATSTGTPFFHSATSTGNSGGAGIAVKAICKDVLATELSVTNGEWTSLQVDTQGALYTTHGITGMVSGKNTGVDSSTSEVIVAAAACKRIDMQASPDNTGYIWVGGSNVAVAQGIRLAPGDFYSIDCDSTGDVYVLATVDEEDIAYTYYT